MKIPYEKLAPETLRNIIEEYVTRSGVGDDMNIDEQANHINTQLAKGAIVIVFDPDTESCSIMSDSEYRRVADTYELAE